jgi:hypothetical protein
MNDRYAIGEVLARYVLAMAERDGKALSELFAPAGVFELFGHHDRDDDAAPDVRIVGRDNIRAMIENGSLPPGRGMYYLTTDHVVEIADDEASIQAQFVAVESNAAVRPESTWTAGSNLVRGTLALTMVGRYDSRLRKVDGRWVFTVHKVKHNLPLALPPEK